MIPKPQRNLVLVELLDDAPTQAGAIIVVRQERQPSAYARVIAVGPEVRDVRVGAEVVVSRLQGIEIGEGQLVLPETAVLAQASDEHSCSQCGGTLDYENNCIVGHN